MIVSFGLLVVLVQGIVQSYCCCRSSLYNNSNSSHTTRSRSRLGLLLQVLVVIVIVSFFQLQLVSSLSLTNQQQSLFHSYNSLSLTTCKTLRRTTTMTMKTTSSFSTRSCHEPISSSYRQLYGRYHNNNNNRHSRTPLFVQQPIIRRSTIYPIVSVPSPIHNLLCNGEILLSTTPTQLRMSNNNNIDTAELDKLSPKDGIITDDNNNNNSQQELNWNRIQKQFHLFIEMSIPYFKESTAAKWLLLGVLVLTIANSGISVLFSYTGKDFWNALSEKNVDEFYHVLGKYVIALGIGAPVTTLYRYQREQLAIHWREWMTARTFTLYTQNQVYYKLERCSNNIINDDSTTTTTRSVDDPNGTAVSSNQVPATATIIDNPDQRITEDVKTFTSFSLQLMITLLTSVIDLVSFSFILWSIYPTLFFAVIGYAATGTIITAILGKNLVTLNFAQLKREADLRYLLVRIRDNAESIAFYSGEELEGRAVSNRVDNVMSNRRSINVAHRNLEFFTNSYRYFIQILPVAVVAPQYFAGTIALGVISQSAGAFNHILSDLSILINQFEQLSAFSAGIERLSDFYTAMKYADPQRTAMNTPLLSPYINVTSTSTTTDSNAKFVAIDDITTIEAPVQSNYDNVNNTYFVPLSEPTTTTKSSTPTTTSPTSGGRYNGNKYTAEYFGQIDLHKWIRSTGNDPLRGEVLAIRSMDLCTPDKKRVLIRDLTLSLQAGENLLIVGSSGAGKSSLLRAIAGLWTVGNGQISRPADEDVYFLPQRPYCTIGSIKDQLLYPSLESIPISQNSNITSGSMQKINNDPPPPHSIPPNSHVLKQSLTDDDLLDILKQVDLLDIAVRSGDGDPYKGLYSIQDWSNQLSLGEQQRLAFGRVLVNRPSLVILDEATSALDITNEAKMYILLRNMAQKTFTGTTGGISAPGLTYISVGHRPSLVNFHDMKLRLVGEGTNHEMIKIEKGSTSTAFQVPISEFANL